VTVLAYVLGEENFFDANGNNVCDNCDNTAGPEFLPTDDMKQDIFRDDNENWIWNPDEPCIGPNSNKTCSTAGDEKYNGVLRNPQVITAQSVYVSKQLVQLFSGSHASFTFNPPALTCPAAGTANVQVTVMDEIGNIMPAGTSIAFSTLFGLGTGTVLPTQFTVPNVVLGVGETLHVPSYTATLACPGGDGKFMVTVTTPNGIQTVGQISVTATAP
jgi:hypothetical protein